MPPVKKRLVFYIHGYDPEADRRYRRLFVTAFSQLSRRFGVARTIGPLVHDETVPAARWTVAAAAPAGQAPAWQTETRYEVLRWDDLVKEDFARGWLRRIPLLGAAMAEALRSAVLQRLFRLDWHFAAFVIYPWIMLGLAVGGAVALGYAAVSLAALAITIPAAVRWAVAIGIAFAIMKALGPRIRDAYVYHLLDGWVFSWQQASGRRPEFDARLDAFARRIVAVARGDDGAAADEILIVGHSAGTTLAVSVAARVLALDPQLGCIGAPLALLTIGSSLPIVSFVRTAAQLRRDIARLAASPSLLWVEYQAPQDVLNAFGFEPVRDLGLDLGGAPQVNPKIRSARFKETLSPATYRKIRWNFFRVHFHFLMANEIPGEYEYLMIACGPVSLADRIADPKGAVRAAYGTPGTDSASAEAKPASVLTAAAGPA